MTQKIWLEHGVNSAKVVGSIPIWVIHSRAGLNGPSGSLPTQSIL